MKREHIADAVLVETGGKLNKKEATAAVNTVLETIAKGIKQEGLVKIAGFGTFRTVKIAAHNGYNVNTKQKTIIPERKRVMFSAYENILNSINDK